MQEFDAIRPYSDEETGTAINNLVRDPEFLDMIGRFKSPSSQSGPQACSGFG